MILLFWLKLQVRLAIENGFYHRPHIRAVKKFLEFFNIDGLVHREFVPSGQSVTGHFYVRVLQMYDAVSGIGATSGKDSGSCITITYRATQHL
jgi:hypothetical protein